MSRKKKTPADDMTDAERSYGVEGKEFVWIDKAGSGDGAFGMGFNSDGSRTLPTDVKKIEKPKKFSREVEDFLWLQSRVLDKLAFHPDLYRVLDRLSYDEIMDRLAGKTGLETVPKQLGGKTEAEYSPETKKYFADLEKKFAKEDEKKSSKQATT